MTGPLTPSTLNALAKILATRARVYMGASPGQVQALGSRLAPASQGHPQVARELGGLAATMALDGEAFFEAAALPTATLFAQVSALREDLNRVLGAQVLLRLSASSAHQRASVGPPAELEQLRNDVRRLRFLQSSITREVHTTLRDSAQASAQVLLGRVAQAGVEPAALPDPSALQGLRSALYALEQEIQALLTLETTWSRTPWREFALRRVLEASDVDLSQDLERLATRSGDPSGLEDAFSHTCLLAEIVERLLTQPWPFGELLAPDASITPLEAARHVEVLLVPRPDPLVGETSFPFRVTVSGGVHRLETFRRQDGQRQEPTYFEQGIALRPHADEDWSDLGPLAPQHRVLVSQRVGTLLQLPDQLAALPSWLAHHAVVNPTSGLNHSLAYANGSHAPYNVLVPSSDVAPEAGDFLRFGDPGGPRLQVISVGSAVSFASIPGTYLRLEVSDPEGDVLDQEGVSLSAHLQALATALSPPTALAKLSAAQGVHVGNLDLSGFGFDDPEEEGVEVVLRVRTPARAYYDDLFDAQVQVAVSGLQSDGIARFADPLFADDPYVDAGWGVDLLLFRVEPGGTSTFSLSVSWPSPSSQAFLQTARTLGLRAVDRSGTHDPVFLSLTDLRLHASDSWAAGDPVEGLAVEGDLVLTFAQSLPSTGQWCLQARSAGQSLTEFSRVQARPQSPWRGWSGLPLDVSPGDRLFMEDGQILHVLASCGSSCLVAPPYRVPRVSPFEEGGEVEGLRVRYLAPGQYLLRASFVASHSLLWRVTSLSYAGGIVLAPQTPTTTDLAVGTYHYSTGVLALDPQTRSYEAWDRAGMVRVEVEDLSERLFERFQREIGAVLGKDPSPTLFVQAKGAVHRIQQQPAGGLSSPTLLLQLGQDPEAALLSIWPPTDGYAGTLTLLERWVDPEGVGAPASPLGGAQVRDLTREVAVGIVSGRLPTSVGATAPIRGEQALRGAIRGPLVRGGSPGFGAWALMGYRLERRQTPDLEEFFREVGKAQGTLGSPRSLLSGQTGLSLTLRQDREGGTLTVADPPGAVGPPTAALLEGVDVLFAEGQEPDPPVRIAVATATGTATVFEVEFSRAVPLSLSGTVSLLDHGLSGAWRETRSILRYLDRLSDALAWGKRARSNRVAQVAARLSRAGHVTAARSLYQGDFERWVDPLALSLQTNDLLSTIEALSEAITRNRSEVRQEMP